ncbi:tyrosine-type recombinase/integrase [Pseudomonas fluorescens]|uniref:tyrosine-type recombinase/integrase n=1 Tax=Pseudomonas fluorescens TaxID=294 RepID=UPI0017803B14|nr:tyrosine-type recombinase/integrase [Pseudomonas fluorescens]
MTGIQWAGGSLDSYAILESGVLDNQSVVVPPTLYLLDLAKRGRSGHTIKANADDLKLLFETLKRFDIDWKDLTDNQMSGYLENILQNEHHLSNESVERHISTSKSFYKTSFKNGLLSVEKNFTFNYVRSHNLRYQGQGNGSPKYNLRQQYLSKNLFNLILAHIKTRDSFIRYRDELVLLFGYHCGLRSSEVTSLDNLQTESLLEKISEADATEHLTITIPIIGKGSKVRYVLVNPYTVNKIRKFLYGARSQLPPGCLLCSVKGKPLSASHATRLFQTTRDIALPSLKKEIQDAFTNKPDQYTVSFKTIKLTVFHSLRHTFATNLVDYCYKNGIDPYQYISEQLGHEREETTKEYITFEANIFSRDKTRKKLNSSMEPDDE